MRNNLKIFIIVLVIILPIILIFVILTNSKNDVVKNSNQNIQKINEQKEVVVENNQVTTNNEKVELSLDTLKNEASEKCKDVISDSEVDNKKICEEEFIKFKANENNSIEACNIIEGVEKKVMCLDEVYLSKGMEETSLEQCKKISNKEQRDGCSNEVLYHLAMNDQEKAESYCNQINSDLKALCLNRFVK